MDNIIIILILIFIFVFINFYEFLNIDTNDYDFVEYINNW